MIAAWQPNDLEFPEGVVLINQDHVVLQNEIKRYQADYPESHEEEIKETVLNVYGEQAVAKIAHSEHLTGALTRPVVEDELRSEAALTMALLGLMGEERLINDRLSGLFRKRQKAS
jgi:hypothetical protein